ncbi:ABC transporter permease, partial [Mesorhizobium sp. M2D.F.Ca.ET.145.01.1.1]
MLSTFIAAEVNSSFDIPRIAAASFILLGFAIVVLSMVGLDLSGKQEQSQTRAPKGSMSRLPIVLVIKRNFSEILRPYRVKRWTGRR